MKNIKIQMKDCFTLQHTSSTGLTTMKERYMLRFSIVAPMPSFTHRCAQIYKQDSHYLSPSQVLFPLPSYLARYLATIKHDTEHLKIVWQG